MLNVECVVKCQIVLGFGMYADLISFSMIRVEWNGMEASEWKKRLNDIHVLCGMLAFGTE